MKVNKKKRLLKLLLSLFLFIIVVLVYKRSTSAYFEQDEWGTFGRYNYILSLDGKEFFGEIFRSGPFSHFTPLSLFSKMSLYKVFGLQAEYYFWVSIFFHSITTVSVYLLLITLSENIFASFLGALFFGLNSSHHQAVTWIGTFEGVQGTVLFGVLSLIFLMKYLKKRQSILLNISCLLILFSLLFKEVGITFYLCLISVLWFFDKKECRYHNILKYGFSFLIYIILHFTYIFFDTKAPNVLGEGQSFSVVSTIYNFLSMPIKIFSQVLFPQELTLTIVRFLNDRNFLTENLLFDLIMIPLGLLTIYFFYKNVRNNKKRRNFLIGILLIILSTIPLLPLNNKSILDSRFLYPATIGVSVLIVETINKKQYYIPILLFLFTSHALFLNKTILRNVQIGEQRKEILKQIAIEFPILPKKVVFFVKSDTSYYGLPDEVKIMPFQSGFGQTILMIYSQKENFPHDFFPGYYLWKLDSQGYREYDDRGFGYYREFDLLEKAVLENNLGSNSVIAFSWNSSKEELTNITESIRMQLK
ncbi:hypothetical protein ACFL15_00735 [Patescibacteria group bacterium]